RLRQGHHRGGVLADAYSGNFSPHAHGPFSSRPGRVYEPTTHRVLCLPPRFQKPPDAEEADRICGLRALALPQRHDRRGRVGTGRLPFSCRLSQADARRVETRRILGCSLQLRQLAQDVGSPCSETVFGGVHMLIRTKRLVLPLAVAALALSAGDTSGQFRRPFMPGLHVGPAVARTFYPRFSCYGYCPYAPHHVPHFTCYGYCPTPPNPAP